MSETQTNDRVRYIHTSCECGTPKHDFIAERSATVKLPCGRDWTPPEMKQFTKYVCPADEGIGHGSCWTGAKFIVSSRDGFCPCGERYVEEVVDETERFEVSWEMVGPFIGDYLWHPTTKEHATRSEAERHVSGLHQLIADGERIRNVRMRRASVAWQEVEV